MIIVLVQIVFRRITATSHLPVEVYSALGVADEVGLEIEVEVGVGLGAEAEIGVGVGVEIGVVWVVHSQTSLEDHHKSYPSAMNHGDSHDSPNDA